MVKTVVTEDQPPAPLAVLHCLPVVWFTIVVQYPPFLPLHFTMGWGRQRVCTRLGDHSRMLSGERKIKQSKKEQKTQHKDQSTMVVGYYLDI